MATISLGLEINKSLEDEASNLNLALSIAPDLKEGEAICIEFKQSGLTEG